jgi:hypothetical protein
MQGNLRKFAGRKHRNRSIHKEPARVPAKIKVMTEEIEFILDSTRINDWFYCSLRKNFKYSRRKSISSYGSVGLLWIKRHHFLKYQD